MGKPRRLSDSDNNFVDAIAHMIVNMKRSSKGRLPHGTVEGYIKDLQNKGISVTRDMLKGRVKAIMKDNGPPLTVETGGITVVSGVTPTTPSTQSESTATADPSDSSTKKAKQRGRPKGTTNLAKSELKILKKRLTDEVTLELAELNKKKTDKNSRLAKGTITNLIKTKSKELNVPEAVASTISNSTVRNRLDRNRASQTPKHRGTPSPLAEIEELVLPIVKGMSRIMQPMQKPEIIALANSLIEGTIHQEKLIEWKKVHAPHQTGENCGKVGVGWFAGFKKRYKDQIYSAKLRRFGAKRSEWMHPEYLQQMYEAIYDIWCDAGVARKLVEAVAYDVTGQVVEKDSPNQFGRLSNIEVTHKDYILFADECGINTCQKNDGHHGGALYMCEKGDVPCKTSNTSDHRATILPFTALSGEPAVLAVIFASANTRVPANWHSGIDVTVDPVLGPDGQPDFDDKELNYGSGKHMPSGPVCSFRGKEIPTLTFTSPNGSINDDILVKIFKTLDEMGIYERGEGLPQPCVVLDGHDSRLSMKVIDYITNPEHTWNLALGVPYLTHIWQVGDSSEQNGSFKIAFSKAKDALVSFKMRQGWEVTLEAYDIIPLINVAWEKSFARVNTNKKAIADRGWFPPTMKVLTDPKLFNATNGSQDSGTISDGTTAPTILNNLDSVNTERGKSGTVMETLLSHAARKDGTKRRMEALAAGNKRRKGVEDTKKISSGLFIQDGVHLVNNPLVRAAFKDRQAKKNMEALRKREKEQNRLRELKDKLAMVREKRGTDPANWNMTECRIFLQFKKTKDDTRMPTTLAELRQLCVKWIGYGRESPYVSEAEEDLDVNENGASEEEGSGVDDDDDRKEEHTDMHWEAQI
jgi:hypothetical protein